MKHVALGFVLSSFVACASQELANPPPSTPAPAPKPIGASPPPPTSGGTACQLPAQPAFGAPKDMCTEMGCVSGFQLDVEPLSSWPHGKYHFEIVADGKKQICDGTLPLLACDRGGSLKCTGDTIASIVESGCALEDKEHAFGSISFDGTPCDVRVVITRDGKPLLDRSFQPSYRWFQPNGPGCDPQCIQARDDVKLVF
jgi:hypothetical protein